MANAPRENIDALCRSAVDHFGTERQMNKAQEECGELIARVNHWREGRENATESLISEIADVVITMKQMTEMFGVDLVDAEIQRKLIRLKNKIRTDRATSGQRDAVIGQKRIEH